MTRTAFKIVYVNQRKPSVNKRNLGGYERRNWIEQSSKQDSYLIQGFYHQLLRYSQPANGEERREGRNGCFRQQR